MVGFSCPAAGLASFFVPKRFSEDSFPQEERFIDEISMMKCMEE